MTNKRTRIEVQYADRNTLAPTKAEVVHWVRAALALSAPNESRSLVVRIVGDDESALLNATYRAKQGPTNVLSFPGPDAASYAPGLPLPLGDIAICAPVVVREAQAQGKPAAAHWAHLVVHGLLHLLGYSHEREGHRRRMEVQEIAVLEALKLPDPYAEVAA